MKFGASSSSSSSSPLHSSTWTAGTEIRLFEKFGPTLSSLFREDSTLTVVETLYIYLLLIWCNTDNFTIFVTCQERKVPPGVQRRAVKI